jgi:uncharacterized membrane protein HdeD (DUF308 family)
MGLGTGATLFAAGAILYWAVDVNVPFVNDNTLGAILMIIGAVTAAAAAVLNASRSRGDSSSTTSGVGSGLVMILIGAILLFAVDVNLPYVADGALGVILIVAGLISVIATVIMHRQNSTSHRVVERRY